MFIHDWNRHICLECLECTKSCPNDNLTSYENRPTTAQINTCVGCGLCRTVCPTKSISYYWVDENGYSKDTPELKTYVQWLAKNGTHRITGMGARRKAASFDDLVFLPGQLFRKPLLERPAACGRRRILPR
ncbi:MAG: 4Fe-4S binding protein [Nitrospinae bacterium]|nr:4Fe-4S binding protein [Nitrospinota bacterium]